ncbi:MAG TPA: Lrp/AsnC family transcriptional regulator [Chromatiales bacterium]|nr:Lrp/AsnC family transcriptional regulator [Chromatiales bacterium]
MSTSASQIKTFPRAKSARELDLSDLEKRLLNTWQKGLPLTSRPYAEMARKLGIGEALVLHLLERLQAQGVISRVGPVFAPRRVGVSTLAAMAVPETELERVAALVNSYPEVNHNYEREHKYNLWFVVTAPDEARLQAVLAEMEVRTGHAVLDLPLEAQYHIDLGFPLWC